MLAPHCFDLNPVTLSLRFGINTAYPHVNFSIVKHIHHIKKLWIIHFQEVKLFNIIICISNREF